MNAKMPVLASKLASVFFGNPGVRGDRWLVIMTFDEVSRPSAVADGRRANVTLTPGELGIALSKITSHAVGSEGAYALQRAILVLRKLDQQRVS